MTLQGAGEEQLGYTAFHRIYKQIHITLNSRFFLELHFILQHTNTFRNAYLVFSLSTNNFKQLGEDSIYRM